MKCLGETIWIGQWINADRLSTEKRPTMIYAPSRQSALRKPYSPISALRSHTRWRDLQSIAVRRIGATLVANQPHLTRERIIA